MGNAPFVWCGRLIPAVAGFLVLNADASAQTRYEYDALGRLVKVERTSAGKTVSYSYDAAGNRTSVVQADAPPASFSVNNTSVLEGGVLTFTVSKADGAGQTYSVSYATANGSAGSADYTAKSGTLTFGSSETSKTVAVQTTQDNVFEAAETVLLNLSNPSGDATIANGQGVGTINNDDAAPRFSINDVTREEGQNLVFTVSKSGATALTHNINYATADNTAEAGSDYVAKSGTLSFAPSEASKTITITGIQDSIVEPTETFTVNLSAATNGATIADGQGVGSITNDDNTPPIARDDRVSDVETFETVSIYPLSNDQDPDGHLITLTNYTVNGPLSVQWHPTVSRMDITPFDAGNFSIDYTISDGNGGTDTARISVNAIFNDSCGPPPCIPLD